MERGGGVKDKIYIGTILLELNRWGNPKTPTYRVSEWTERFREAGFDGMELWEYHATLCSEAERKALEASSFPVAVYNSYGDFDDGSEDDRRGAAEMVRALGAGGVKYNVGKDPALRDEYLRNLRAWAEALPEDCRLLCECHGGTIIEEPEAAAKFFGELEDGRYQIVVHCFMPELDRLRAWFRAFGPAITLAHVQLGAGGGRRDRLDNQPEHVREALRVMRGEGFQGAFTLEFTQGTREPGENVADLWEAALADLHFLKENLS